MTWQPWAFLFAAGACEVAWAIGLKTYGFTLTRGGITTVILMLLSFLLLERAMRHLPLGTSYAIWTGIGAVGASLFGILVKHETKDWRAILCIALIVGGVMGLKALTPTPPLTSDAQPPINV